MTKKEMYIHSMTQCKLRLNSLKETKDRKDFEKLEQRTCGCILMILDLELIGLDDCNKWLDEIEEIKAKKGWY